MEHRAASEARRRTIAKAPCALDAEEQMMLNNIRRRKQMHLAKKDTDNNNNNNDDDDEEEVEMLNVKTPVESTVPEPPQNLVNVKVRGANEEKGYRYNMVRKSLSVYCLIALRSLTLSNFCEGSATRGIVEQILL